VCCQEVVCSSTFYLCCCLPCPGSPRDYDGKVTPEELAAAAAMLRDSLGQGEISELIANLAKDRGQYFTVL